MCPLDRIGACDVLVRAEAEHVHKEEQGDKAYENADAFGQGAQPLLPRLA
jgi:hypothetical protein